METGSFIVEINQLNIALNRSQHDLLVHIEFELVGHFAALKWVSSNSSKYTTPPFRPVLQYAVQNNFDPEALSLHITGFNELILSTDPFELNNQILNDISNSRLVVKVVSVSSNSTDFATGDVETVLMEFHLHLLSVLQSSNSCLPVVDTLDVISSNSGITVFRHLSVSGSSSLSFNISADDYLAEYTLAAKFLRWEGGFLRQPPISWVPRDLDSLSDSSTDYICEVIHRQVDQVNKQSIFSLHIGGELEAVDAVHCPLPSTQLSSGRVVFDNQTALMVSPPDHIQMRSDLWGVTWDHSPVIFLHRSEARRLLSAIKQDPSRACLPVTVRKTSVESDSSAHEGELVASGLVDLSPLFRPEVTFVDMCVALQGDAFLSSQLSLRLTCNAPLVPQSTHHSRVEKTSEREVVVHMEVLPHHVAPPVDNNISAPVGEVDQILDLEASTSDALLDFSVYQPSTSPPVDQQALLAPIVTTILESPMEALSPLMVPSTDPIRSVSRVSSPVPSNVWSTTRVNTPKQFETVSIDQAAELFNAVPPVEVSKEQRKQKLMSSLSAKRRVATASDSDSVGRGADTPDDLSVGTQSKTTAVDYLRKQQRSQELQRAEARQRRDNLSEEALTISVSVPDAPLGFVPQNSLHPDWTECFTATGDAYYYHRPTEVVQWEHPGGLVNEADDDRQSSNVKSSASVTSSSSPRLEQLSVYGANYSNPNGEDASSFYENVDSSEVNHIQTTTTTGEANYITGYDDYQDDTNNTNISNQEPQFDFEHNNIHEKLPERHTTTFFSLNHDHHVHIETHSHTVISSDSGDTHRRNQNKHQQHHYEPVETVVPSNSGGYSDFFSGDYNQDQQQQRSGDHNEEQTNYGYENPTHFTEQHTYNEDSHHVEETSHNPTPNNHYNLDQLGHNNQSFNEHSRNYSISPDSYSEQQQPFEQQYAAADETAVNDNYHQYGYENNINTNSSLQYDETAYYPPYDGGDTAGDYNYNRDWSAAEGGRGEEFVQQQQEPVIGSERYYGHSDFNNATQQQEEEQYNEQYPPDAEYTDQSYNQAYGTEDYSYPVDPETGDVLEYPGSYDQSQPPSDQYQDYYADQSHPEGGEYGSYAGNINGDFAAEEVQSVAVNNGSDVGLLKVSSHSTEQSTTAGELFQFSAPSNESQSYADQQPTFAADVHTPHHRPNPVDETLHQTPAQREPITSSHAAFLTTPTHTPLLRTGSRGMNTRTGVGPRLTPIRSTPMRGAPEPLPSISETPQKRQNHSVPQGVHYFNHTHTASTFELDGTQVTRSIDETTSYWGGAEEEGHNVTVDHSQSLFHDQTQQQQPVYTYSETDQWDRTAFAQSKERGGSVSSLSDRSQTDQASVEPTPSVGSGSVRHIEVWTKFFQNALTAKRPKKSGPDTRSQLQKVMDSTQTDYTPPTPPSPRNKKPDHSEPSSDETRWPPPLSERRFSALLATALAQPDGGGISVLSDALLVAVSRGDLSATESLLLAGANPNSVDSSNRSAALYLIHGGDNLELLGMLFDNGADLEQPDREGITPLMAAVICERTQIVQFLLSCAVSADSLDNSRNTALHLAARGGHADFCRELMEYFATPSVINRRNNTGLTALDVALALLPQGDRWTEVVSVLSSAGDAALPNSYSSSKSKGKSSSLRKGNNFHKPMTNSDDSSERKVSHLKDRAKEALLKGGVGSSSADSRSVADRTGEQKTRVISTSDAPAFGSSLGIAERSNDEKPPRHPKKVTRFAIDTLQVTDSSSTPTPAAEEEGDYSDEEDEEELIEEVEENSSRDAYSEAVVAMVWRLAVALIDLSLGMFGRKVSGGGGTRAGVSSNKVAVSPPHWMWGLLYRVFAMGRGTDQSTDEHDIHDSTAHTASSLPPPTDQELRNRGLGFHPPPIDLEVIKGTPTRSAVWQAGSPSVTPPSEVQVAVAMARVAERNRTSPGAGYNSDPFSPPPLLSVNMPAPLTSLLDARAMSGGGGQSPASDNGYSLGKSLPAGVSWRYVDVMKTPTHQQPNI